MSQGESNRWSSVTLDTLLLHDGLQRVTDLVELPDDVQQGSSDQSVEIISFDSNNPQELAEQLKSFCSKRNLAYGQLLQYRLNAIVGLWRSQRDENKEEPVSERDRDTDDERSVSETVPFTSRVSLLLVFPLLEHESSTRPELRIRTSRLLLDCLTDYPPLALIREPKDCFSELETLLCDWLGRERDSGAGQEEIETTTACLVALACARGTVRVFVRAIHVLESFFDHMKQLRVKPVVQRLTESDSIPSGVLCLLPSNHIVCWAFDDRLKPKKAKSEWDRGRSIACDGHFLYVTGTKGTGLVKLGTGLHGTIRGYQYSIENESNAAWIVWADGYLLQRPVAADTSTTLLANIVDRATLKTVGTVNLSEGDQFSSGSRTTLSLCSDGQYVFWVWCGSQPVTIATTPGDKTRVLPVHVQPFRLKEEVNGGVLAESLHDGVIIKHKDSVTSSTTSSGKVNRNPFVPRYQAATSLGAATLLAAGTSKEDPDITSCGLTTKTLNKSAIFTDGTYLVIVIGQSNGSVASRSLFGASSLSKGVATSWCFHLAQGDSRGRMELSGIGSNAFARGSAVEGAGICYDPVNNSIWSCVHDYVDQWQNTCQLSNHHVARRLGLPRPRYGLSLSVSGDDRQMVSVQETRRVLLQHLGIICCNELAADKRSHRGDEKLPDIDSMFLKYTLQLLTSAVDREDMVGVQCILMIVQVLVTSLNFEGQPLDEKSSLFVLRDTVWKLATDPSSPSHIKTQAARVISCSLPVFYRSTNDIHSVLSNVIDLPADSTGLILRDQLLMKIASQLTDVSASQPFVTTVNLLDSVVERVLQFVIEEAYRAIREVQTASVEQLEKITSVTPQASPCLIFLSSVVSSLLNQIVLCSSDEQATDEMQAVVHYILHLAKIVFAGCRQVLDVVLEVCDVVSSRDSAQREVSLNALERVAKGTALGHLLPVLVCCLNHPSLKSLSLAENLVSHLVLLTVLTSKAALLLKGKFKSLALRQDSVEAITQTGLAAKEDVSSQPFDSQEVGYLSSLLISSPWTAGKSVETIHPVRDNYKFKETVRIPGARNLFLKFDPRCSSQYDYDKVVVHAGPATNGKKIAEYGGNTHGFGSRSVLGAGWPKDPIKVEGDTVTFSFEMRSGREHNTPDRACWGFACTVRAQETLDEGEGTGLPFMADLALGLSVLSCSLIQILYDGPVQSPDEESCQDMFTHRLMHRCIWPSSEKSEPFVAGDEKLLLYEEVKELRTLSGRVAPSLRPRIEKIIQRERVECLLASAVLKQLKLLPQVGGGRNESLLPVSSYLFTKIDALMRQIASICETEMNWLHDVSDITRGVLQPVDTFFVHYAELGKVRELQLLCDMVNVEANPLDWFETVRQLTEELNKQAAQTGSSQSEDLSVPVDSKLAKTEHIVEMIIEKAELLLHITLSLPDLSEADDQLMSSKQPELGLTYARSVSAPSELPNMRLELKEGIQELLKLRQWQSSYKKKIQPHTTFQLSAEIEFTGSSPQQQFINELLAFISDGEGQVGLTSKFLSAAKLRHSRGQSRSRALRFMKELMDAAREVGGATQLVSYISPVLAQGPRVGELTCGGLDNAVQSGYEDALAAVVSLARQQPIACLNSIGLLCVIPYGKAEEACLVGSGLLQLLDVLCCPKAVTGDREVQRKVGAIAWAGFRVLADRCVSWEEKDQQQTMTGESGLAHQVSNLLSNHLARVSHGHSEALHNALAYLHSLSQRSNMGKAIISQPACIARLLSLLVEQRPTPKLVQVVLQLCSVALPLMSVNDSEAVRLPVIHQLSRDETGLSAAAQIVHLLIAKLGDFVMPMFFSTATTHSNVPQNLSSSRIEILPTDESERDDEMDRVSVFIHKRQDQSAHEVIQPLLSSDSRPFRLGGAANMDRVMKMDRTMNHTGRAEAVTDDRRLCLRKAARWAQVGFVVSIGPPADGVTSATTADDRKKRMAEEVCQDRNEDLAGEDCMRPFISGHVANSMASDIIAVLHSLLSSKESKIWHVWSNAIRNVLLSALDSVPSLVSSLACHASMEESTETPGDIMSSAKSALAALCSLGGFKESLRPGCNVQIKDGAGEPTRAEVLSISDHEGVATVCLHDDTISYHHKNTLQVPLCCLVPPSSETLPLGQLDVTNQVVKAVESLLTSALPSSLMIPTEPVESTLSVEALACARLLGEMRTRACMLLSQHVMEPSFAQAFLETAHQPLKTLCELANRCSPGERLPVVEQLCEKLRMLYRDCSRPAAPLPAPKPREVKQITFDLNRSFPQPRSCILCNNYKDVTFLGDSVPVSAGHPRGLLLFATSPVEASASAFYWEVELVHLSDSSEDDSIQFSLGFMPNVESAKESWNPPEGSCLLHSTGRAYVYGSGVLDRKSFPFDIRMKTGDVLGMGWMRQVGTPSVGTLFVTLNGNKLESQIDNVQANLWPIVHLQKKNGRIRANFGSSSFVFEEGQQLASSSERDPMEEVQSTFRLLPFHSASDTDSDSGASASNPTASAQITHISTMRPSSPIATIGYEASASSRYELPLSYDSMISSGPPVRAGAGQPPEMVFQEEDEKEKSGGVHEDLHGLLVKAWETKVFPVIKRRFRNESERKSGLEQIKGALQLGMADIARQTVEFLYEENGGIPRDLHLPTLVEVKADMEKFTIGRLHKGMHVVIRSLDNSGSLPKFAVVNMLKTFGLIGTVLDVDKSHELVQVETYLETEGALVHYWYPVSALEKPPKGHQHVQKNLTAASIDSLTFHRVLLQSEVKLSRLYCRTALLSLVNYSQPSDVLSDVDQLRLLSYHLLCCPQPDGTAQLNSLNTAPSSEQCLRSIACSPLTVFFATGEKHLATKLCSVIKKASSSRQLAELASCLCNVLQLAPKAFQHVELKFTENSSSSTDVYLAGAAAIVVACQTNGKGPNEAKGPWARLLVYRGASEGGQRLQTERLEIMRYPNDSMSMPSSKGASSKVYCGDRFPSFILPCDRLHVVMTPCSGIKACLRFHAVPPDLPVALAFMVSLVDNFDKLIEIGDKEQLAQSLTYCIESLCKLLYRSELAITIKELLFHVLACTLRLFCSESCLKPYVGNLKFCQQKLSSTAGELKELVESETGSKSAEKKDLDLSTNRLSTYCQCLFEFVAALWCVGCETREQQEQTPECKTQATVAAAVSPPPAKASPRSGKEKTPSKGGSGVKKRKVLKKKAAAKKTTGDTPTNPVAESSTSTKAAKKPEPKAESDSYPDWLRKALNALTALHCVTSQQHCLSNTLKEMVNQGSKSASFVLTSRRLLVIRGLPETVNADEIGSIMSHVCSAHGGLFRGELYLPSTMRMCEVEDEIERNSTQRQGVDHSADSQGESPQDEDDKLSDGTASLVSQVEELATQARNMVSTVDSDIEHGHLASLQEVLSEARDALSSAIGDRMTRHLVEQALGSLVVDSESDGENDDVPEQFASGSVSGFFAEALAQELALDSAVESDNLYVDLDLVQSDDRDSPHQEVQPDRIQSESDAPVEETQSSHEQDTAIEEKLPEKPAERRTEMRNCCEGVAVLEVRCAAKLLAIRTALLDCSQLTRQGGKKLVVQSVNEALHCEDEELQAVLQQYLLNKLIQEGKLTQQAHAMFAALFQSCVGKRGPLVVSKKEAMANELMARLIPCCQPAEGANSLFREQGRTISEEHFLNWLTKQTIANPVQVWRALVSSGYDLQLNRVAEELGEGWESNWSDQMDRALVLHIDSLCDRLVTTPSQMEPDEIFLDESDYAKAEMEALHGVSKPSLAARFTFLLEINHAVANFLLPLADMRVANTYRSSIASLLAQSRELLFYHTKMVFFNRTLNSSAHRSPDEAPPEITLDPLEVVGRETSDLSNSQFCQALRQLNDIPSSKLRVKLAAGGDPTFAFNVRYTGEEVHGTSGSFRHFLSQVAKELSSQLPLLITCPSSSAGRNKGKLILKPGPMSYGEEKLLQFFGQLLGVAIRAEVPFPLDLLPCFWKSLLECPLDREDDLREADILTYNLLKNLVEVKAPEEFNESSASTVCLSEDLSGSQLVFVYPSVRGEEVELCSNGSAKPVTWDNRLEFVELVKDLRSSELASGERMTAIRCGMASIVPIQLLHLLTPRHIQLRTCGHSEINLAYLKAHTMYQVGLMETDKHIQYFWRALESFSQDELRRFVKFACNQERIPMGQQCRSTTDLHIPPFPMKIAPPDGKGPPDNRFIRAETCMFMVKLPQYSSQTIMTERLRYAIHCREDPLSG